VSPGLDVVFLDVGGPLYSDGPYYHSILSAFREMGAEVDDEAYAREYERCRRAQDGSFRVRLAQAFLGPDADVQEVARRAARHWTYTPASLQPDVLETLEKLAGRYRLGVIANQLRAVRDAMSRDGIDRFFEVWAVSEELGMEKPDPRIFERALELAHAPPEHCAMAGDRLDYDIRPAKRLGMRTVWVLRGEAPAEPTSDQLAEPDAAVRTLAQLPAVLERLEAGPRARGA
jgi:HAD superfamily hydrolase (TIGR01549 family)